MRKARLIFSFWIIMIFLLSSGCAERPFLSKESHYQIVVISTEDEISTWPIEFTWDANLAVLQQLLLEASLVLGDLQTIHPDESINNLQPNENQIGLTKEVEISLPHETEIVLPHKTETSIQAEELTEEVPIKNPTILLEAFFTEAKAFELVIDGKKETIDSTSVQIEIQGKHPGLVILNHQLKYQGIINPSLESAFANYLAMVEKANLLKQISGSENESSQNKNLPK